MSAPESWHVIRTMRALELLATGPHSLDEVADAVGIHPRTARRLLNRLMLEGYVSRTEGSRKFYSATMRIVSVAGSVLKRSVLVQHGAPYVARLRDRTGETARLAVPASRFVVPVLQESAERDAAVTHCLGAPIPSHTSALGKAMLAHRPDWCEAVLGASLEQHSGWTPVDSPSLLLDLDRTRERGYAVDDLEQELGVRCVAAPIFDRDGKAVAAMSVAASLSSLPLQRCAEIGRVVAEVAADLSEALRLVSAAPRAPGQRADTMPRKTHA